MHLLTIAGRRYAQFETLRDAPGLVHGFATRPLDVGMRADDLAPQRAASRQQMACDLGVADRPLACCVQIHQTQIAQVDSAHNAGPLDGYDAVITSSPEVVLMTFSADCPLIIVYDPQVPAIGLAHASWRCTVAELTRKLVADMHATFGSDPAHLHAGIGPGAGPCCYEVQEDLRAAAAVLPNSEHLFHTRAGRLYFDLWQANRDQLRAAGLPNENIESANLCTMCHSDLFFSFRREKAGCGHFGLLAALKPT